MALAAANSCADLAQAAQQRAEVRALAADARLADYMEASRTRTSIEESERNALREENKLLIDRIVQMSGQPPIFHPAPTPPTPEPAPAQTSAIPAPETGVSFADIHRKTRAAIADGTLNVLTRQA